MSSSEIGALSVSTLIADTFEGHNAFVNEFVRVLGRALKTHEDHASVSDFLVGRRYLKTQLGMYPWFKKLRGEDSAAISQVKELEDEFETTTSEQDKELQALAGMNDDLWKVIGRQKQQIQESDDFKWMFFDLGSRVADQNDMLERQGELIVKYQATNKSLAEGLKAELEGRTTAATELREKANELAAVKQNLNVKDKELKTLRKSKQPKTNGDLEAEVHYLQKALLEKVRIIDADHEEKQELLEDLKTERQTSEALKKQLSVLQKRQETSGVESEPIASVELGHSDMLHYMKTLLREASLCDNLSEAATVLPSPERGGHDLITPSSGRAEEALERDSHDLRLVDNLNTLIHHQQMQVESLEIGLRSAEAVISCKNRTIDMWERALGSCYAELERMQDSGNVDTRVIQLDTSLWSDDDYTGQPTMIRTVLQDSEIIDGLRVEAMGWSRSHIEDLEAQIKNLERVNAELTTALFLGCNDYHDDKDRPVVEGRLVDDR